MTSEHRNRIERLVEKGVRIPNPRGIEIGPEVDLDRISSGVTLHTGAKIFGAETLVLPGTVIGYEGPATIENCLTGRDVSLSGGYFSDAVFLEKASVGSGGHVRKGTILEEQASAAHTVGLKMTLLFPYVTLGSLINFCDCFMAGGTSRKDHSEVGSSYIHFNYTPNQDKATASLIGDVPHGVMLNQRPIFLGGQGGMVGPCRIAYGTIISAGSICRKDELRPGRLVIGQSGRGGSIPFTFGIYQNIKRVVASNLVYIANLKALLSWYDAARRLFVSADRFPEALLNGLIRTLRAATSERIDRLEALSRRMPEAIETYRRSAGNNASANLIRQKQALSDHWPALRGFLDAPPVEDLALRERFLGAVDEEIGRSGKDYLRVIHQLSETARTVGTAWLQGIVNHVTDGAQERLEAF